MREQSMNDTSKRHEQGMATRRAVLGDAHVNRAEAAKTEFDGAFQALITEAAWGHVWSRDTITKRERSMMTLALLAGLGNYEELALHTRATANTGATRDDIMEVMLHVAIYAGVPRANHAIKVVKQVLAEMDKEAGK
jgi:4-carboxymuconolactone decarboxylase